DLLVLAALAAGYARLAAAPSGFVFDHMGSAQSRSQWSAGAALALAFAALGLLGLCRGVADAGGWAFGWFDGYVQDVNSVRVGKSLIFAAAFWLLLKSELRRSTPHAIRCWSLGMQLGLTVVGLAVLWERAAYPGLLDFSSRYRTTALFWEMHVGGAAIDGYLALATPFAALALWSARSRRAWAAAAGLALLTGYACLTTYSRGVYLAVAAPLLGLAVAWWWLGRDTSSRRPAFKALARWLMAAAVAASLLSAAFATLGYAGLGAALGVLTALTLVMRVRRPALRWRTSATMFLMLALLTEAVAVIGGGSFMRMRLLESEHDFGSRLAHWRHGLGLLHGPTDWLLGIGLGRLPSHYARFVPGGEFSGAVSLAPSEAGRQVLRLSGPPTDEDLGGLYALTQRVALLPGGAYRVSLVVRATVTTELSLSVCEEHLLYARNCQLAAVRVEPRGGGWQQLTARLRGPVLSAGDWYAPRLGVFAMSVTNAGAAAEVAHVELLAPDGDELLANRDFAAALAHWFPAAQFYFMPWHIDNLALEILIERGLSGLAVFVALLGCVLVRLARLARAGSSFAPILAASLCGALLVGSVSSLMDVPQVAFLLLFLVVVSLQLPIQNRVLAAD
ncbi:MAG: hypothetical protein KGI87_13035, partial [Burkholderiales bacterium]|nr:hypothetical protein [Burkholderiales bacterium]